MSLNVNRDLNDTVLFYTGEPDPEIDDYEAEEATTLIDIYDTGYYEDGDIMLVDETGGIEEEHMGNESYFGEVPGFWRESDRRSRIAFDYNEDREESTPNIRVSDGSATYIEYPEGSQMSEEAGLRYLEHGDDDESSIYFDLHEYDEVSFGPEDGDLADFRMRAFEFTYDADSTVGSEDLDEGLTLSDFAEDEWYLDDGDDDFVDGEPIIRNDEANLTSEMEIITAGTVEGSAHEFTSGIRHDGTEGYEEGYSIISDEDENYVYQDVFEDMYVKNDVLEEELYEIGLSNDQIAEMKVYNVTDDELGYLVGDGGYWCEMYDQWNITDLDHDLTEDDEFAVTMDIEEDATGRRFMVALGNISLASEDLGEWNDVESNEYQEFDGPPGIESAVTESHTPEYGNITHVNATFDQHIDHVGLDAVEIEERGEPAGYELFETEYDESDLGDGVGIEIDLTNTVRFEIASDQVSEEADGHETPYLQFTQTEEANISREVNGEYLWLEDGEGNTDFTFDETEDGIGPVLIEFEGQLGAKTASIKFSQGVYGSGEDDSIIDDDLEILEIQEVEFGVYHEAGRDMAVLEFGFQINQEHITSAQITPQDSIEDEFGNEAIEEAEQMTDVRDAIALTPGWNLVSLPVSAPYDYDLEQTIDENEDIDRGWHPDELGEVDTLDAFFVNADYPTELDLMFLEYEPNRVPGTRDLEGGSWNLVGPNLEIREEDQIEINTTIEQYLAPVDGAWSTMVSLGYNLEHWLTVDAEEVAVAETQVNAYEGYWLFMREDGTLAGRTV